MTTAEAADRLGIKPRSVVKLIREGRIIASRHGRDYWLEETEVQRYSRERRPAHRPQRSKEVRADGAGIDASAAA